MTRFTVLGSTGFIGSRLVETLREAKHEPTTPSRSEVLSGRDLGHVLYCIGLTADFRERPLDAIDAHVSKLADVVRGCRFDSLLYLSSCRVYKGLPGPVSEDALLRVDPSDCDDFYNVTKLLGEAVTLSGPPTARVVRLSNVYGPGQGSANFLGSILRDALERGRIDLRTTLDSEKDYVNVDTVARLLPEIAIRGTRRIYNVASGANVPTSRLVERMQASIAVRVDVVAQAPRTTFPVIDVSRVRAEFDFHPSDVLADIPALLKTFTR
jgi:nucleoside-diphosphate-sugar epimerase